MGNPNQETPDMSTPYSLEPPWPDGLSERLAALPVFAPPAQLRARVLVPHAPRWHWAAAAAVVLALVGVLATRLPQFDAATANATDLATLERSVLAARTGEAAVTPVALELEAQLARIDGDLQSAADVDDAGELARLGRERQRLLETLLIAYRSPEALTRI
jgi:hypothetical protein